MANFDDVNKTVRENAALCNLRIARLPGKKPQSEAIFVFEILSFVYIEDYTGFVSRRICWKGKAYTSRPDFKAKKKNCRPQKTFRPVKLKETFQFDFEWSVKWFQI